MSSVLQKSKEVALTMVERIRMIERLGAVAETAPKFGIRSGY